MCACECVCVCVRERESYSQLVPSPSECTQCAWVFDQLLEVWGQGLVSIFRGGAETRSGKTKGWELSLEVCYWLQCDFESRCFFVVPQD